MEITNNQNFVSQNNQCFCNLSVSFKNQNSNNENYHIIKLYKYGVDQPIYSSGPIQTNGEIKNILNMFLDCNQE
jgi:hypothetical protein